METFSNCALNKGGREKCVFFSTENLPYFGNGERLG